MIAFSSPIIVKAVVKAMPQNVGRCKTFRSADFFRNEANFYKHVLPAMLDFQEKRGVLGTQVAFSEVPKFLFAYIDGTNDFIALEDLCPDGFGSASRQAGVDFEHCRIIMQILGKFHAVSLAIGDQEPELLVQMIKSLNVRNTYKIYKQYLVNKYLRFRKSTTLPNSVHGTHPLWTYKSKWPPMQWPRNSAAPNTNAKCSRSPTTNSTTE